MRDPHDAAKIIANYAVALAVEAGLALGLGWNPFAALPIAVLVLLGVYYVLNPAGVDGSGAAELRAEARAKLDECRAHIAHIRVVAERMDALPVQTRLLSICVQAERIIGSDKELSLTQATRLKYIFQQAVRIVDPYALVVESKDERRIWARMKHEVEEGDVFPMLDKSLSDLRTQLDKSDALEIDAALAALKALTSEGL